MSGLNKSQVIESASNAIVAGIQQDHNQLYKDNLEVLQSVFATLLQWDQELNDRKKERLP